MCTTGERNWSQLKIEDFQDCSYSEEDVQATGKFRAVSDGIELASITGTREFGGLGASLAVVNLTVGNKGSIKNLSRLEVSWRKFWWLGNLWLRVMTVGESRLAGWGFFCFFVFCFLFVG